jgi:hypothetical protein
MLYPRDFRDRYSEDLVQTLTDMSAELGPRRAWRRVTLDLVITVPRYRMETLMKDEHSSKVVIAATTAMACAGILSLFIGLYLGVLLVPIAAVVAITQRGRWARSMDAVDASGLRRKRLKIAAVLAASLPVIYLVSLPILGDEWGTDATVAFALWTAVLIAAVAYFVSGITTPKPRVISR